MKSETRLFVELLQGRERLAAEQRLRSWKLRELQVPTVDQIKSDAFDAFFVSVLWRTGQDALQSSTLHQDALDGLHLGQSQQAPDLGHKDINDIGTATSVPGSSIMR